MRISELISPRIVVLISTIDKQNRPNAAPFSFVMPVSFNPPIVAFCPAETRDTFKNICEIPEFVVNIPTDKMLKEINICAKPFPRGVNEIKEANLTEEKSEKVKPPRIKECPVQLECKFIFKKKFGDHYIIVGKVLKEHVKGKFNPLLHHSGNEYLTIKKLK